MKRNMFFLCILIFIFYPLLVEAKTCDNDKVSISSIKVENKSENVIEFEEAFSKGKNIYFNLGMVEKGDNIEYKITINNASDDVYEITKNSFNIESPYLNYSIKTIDNSYTVKANSSKELSLRIEYENEVPLEELKTGSYSENKNILVGLSKDELPINPNTAGNICLAIILLFILSSAVIITRKKVNKKYIVPIIVSILIVPISVLALCKIEIRLESNVKIVGTRLARNCQADSFYDKDGNYIKPDNTYCLDFDKQGIEKNPLAIIFVDTKDFSQEYEYDGKVYQLNKTSDVSDFQNGQVLLGVYYNEESSTSIILIGQENDVKLPIDSSKLFHGEVPSISVELRLDHVNTEDVIDMSEMFSHFGQGAGFTEKNIIDLGPNFDTKNVKDMHSMFEETGMWTNKLVINLGDKFDTSKVTDMSKMFASTGYEAKDFILDLGDKFDTNKVTNMESMFSSAGYASNNFYIDLKDKYDTHNVTNMKSMFVDAGAWCEKFTLNLGNKFDTSKVTDMSSMFAGAGYDSKEMKLDLGDKFDTSNVTDMTNMFGGTGHSSHVFTLNLGDKFDTHNVKYMANMFYHTGENSNEFTLDLGDKFDTSNVETMISMFEGTGEFSPSFSTLRLGDKFDTSKITHMLYMFKDLGAEELDLGPKFNTSNVTCMNSMFYQSHLITIYAPDNFDTSKVTDSAAMFSFSSEIIGGEGTTYQYRTPYLDLAHIDGGPTNPGYFTSRNKIAGAMFKPGPSITNKRSLLVGYVETGDSSDIKRVARYNGIPSPRYLKEENIVSTWTSTYPIYMWYDEGEQTIYWYSKTDDVYYPRSSRYFYENLDSLESLSNIDDIKTDYIIDMTYMFENIGFSDDECSLNLGDKFNPVNAKIAYGMFSGTGRNCSNFTIDLGKSFEGKSLKDVSFMFDFSNTLSRIYVSDKLDLSSVEKSLDMFDNCENLIGGQGTTYDHDHIGLDYAHIDGGPTNPGYFTESN